MEYTADSLKLVCGLKQHGETSEECFKHVLSALHVTLADVMRSEVSRLLLHQLLSHLRANVPPTMVVFPFLVYCDFATKHGEINMFYYH